MQINLKQNTWLMNFEYMAKNFSTDDPSLLHIDFGEGFRSFHPLVYSMVGAMALEVKRNNGTITISGDEAAVNYLNKNIGLDNLISSKKSSSYNSVLIPLTQIRNDIELKHFIQDIVPLLHCPIESAGPIKYVFSEMIRNVLEHSKSKNGAIVCARYSESTNRISIGISDTGIGITKAISQSHNPSDNAHSLILALTPGITGTTSRLGGTAYNAGAGLFFTRSIAKLSKNVFILFSSDTMYKLRRGRNDGTINADPLKDNHSLRSFAGQNWEGTLVGIDFTLENQPQFEALLSDIRAAYKVDVRNRNKEKYRKPKFI